MTCTTNTNGLLRMDERGRVRVGKERRAELLAEYDRSAMSGAAFARWAGIKYPTFASWLQQRRNGYGGTRATPRPSATGSAAVQWAEIVAGQAPAVPGGAKLSVRLPGGASLDLDASRESPRLAVELLRELERTAANAGGPTC